MDLSKLMDNAAEAGVISSLIYHPEFLLVDNNLQPRFFYNQENAMMFWAIDKLVSSGVTNIDAINLNNVLSSNAAVVRVMKQYGIDNIQQYIDMAKIAARDTYEEYRMLADTVITYAFRRELCNMSDSIGKECFNMNLTLDQLNDYVNNGISGIADKFIFGGDTVQFGEKIDSIWKEICEDRNDDGSVGIPNLIPALDEYYTFGKGELVLVAGATGKGKSSLMLAQSTNAMKQGIPVVMIDSELSDKVFAARLLANLTGIPVRTIKNGRYNNEEEQRIKKTITWIQKSKNLVHEYIPTFSKLTIEQICRKYYNRNQLGFLIYDYIKPSNRFGAADISQDMGLMADFLKSLVGKMNVPGMAGLQLHQATGTLADSFKTERYADVLIYWKEKTAEQLRKDGLDCGNFYIQVIKNRNGMISGEDDYIDVKFIGDLMSITQAKQHENIADTPFEE